MDAEKRFRKRLRREETQLKKDELNYREKLEGSLNNQRNEIQKLEENLSKSSGKRSELMDLIRRKAKRELDMQNESHLRELQRLQKYQAEHLIDLQKLETKERERLEKYEKQAFHREFRDLRKGLNEFNNGIKERKELLEKEALKNQSALEKIKISEKL